MDSFEEIIKSFLDKIAESDSQFAEKYANPKKSIEECCRYIKGEASKQAKDGVAAIDDGDVFSMAVHYYDEDNIVITPIKDSYCISSNVTYEPTEEDKKNARKAALKRLETDAYNEIRGKQTKKEKVEANQLSMF